MGLVGGGEVGDVFEGRFVGVGAAEFQHLVLGFGFLLGEVGGCGES